MRAGLDANRNLIDYTVTCWLGNEDKAAWVALNNATKVAVSDYDSLEQLDAHDGCKGASSAHHTAFRSAKEARDTKHRTNIFARPKAQGGEK